MGQIKVDSDQGPGFTFSDKFLSTSKCLAADVGILAYMSSESLTQMHLLMQAQTLIKKNLLYELIDKELRGLMFFQPVVFNFLPCRSTDYEDQEERNGQELPLLSFHRDLAISNLRFLSIFYASCPKSFALATNLIDRLLSKVVVLRKSLSIVATCCFYLAVSYYGNGSIPINIDDLIRVTQCETTREIFNFVTDRIQNEVWNGQQPVTPVSLMELFYDVFALQDVILQNEDLKTFMIMKLGTLLCHFRFMKFRYDILALTFLHHFLQRMRRMDNTKLRTVLELQLYCRMDEAAYNECFGLVEQFTYHYETQATKQPRIKLNWTVSRRLLLKRRPSLLVKSSLHPVLEEEFSWEISTSVLQPPASDTVLVKTSQGYLVRMDSAADSEDFDSSYRRSPFELHSQGNQDALAKNDDDDVVDDEEDDDDDDDSVDNSVILCDEKELLEAQRGVFDKGVDDSVISSEERCSSNAHFEMNVSSRDNLFITNEESDFAKSKCELRDYDQGNSVTSLFERGQSELKDRNIENSFVTADERGLIEPQSGVKVNIQDNSVNMDDEKGFSELQSEVNDKNFVNLFLNKMGLENDKSLDFHILSCEDGVRATYESQAQRSQGIWGKGESFGAPVISDAGQAPSEFHSTKRNEEAIKSLGSQIIRLSDDNNNRVI